MKKLLYILLLVSLSLASFAGNSDREKRDNKVVSGRITDVYGEAVAGAKITIPETGETFFADFDGKYKLSVKTDKEYSIVVNTLGYQPLQVKSSALNAFADLSLKSL